MNTQIYTVNVRVGGAGSPRVAVSQGDIGRLLMFRLFDGATTFTPASGTTVTIVGRKPSGLGFTEECTLAGGNSVSVRTTEAMTQEAGKIPAELRISDGTKVIGTANFVFYIEPSPHPDGTTDGTHATVDNLQTQIGNLANLATTAKTNLVSAINEAAQSGGVVIDDTLTQTGQAADAKKTGDEISAIKADLGDLDERVEALETGGSGDGDGTGGLPAAFSLAMYNMLSHLTGTFDDEHGQDYIDAVIASLDNSGGGDSPTPDPDPSGGGDEARIPSDYQEVEYVISNGNSYFKIEKPAGALPVKIETGLYKTTQATSEQCVIMAREGNTTCWELGFNSTANTIFVFSSQSAKVSNAAVYGNKIDVVAQLNTASPYKQLSVTADETTLTAESTNPNAAAAGSTNAVLNFFAAIGSTVANKAACRMYYCKIYDASNNLVVDLVPCYRKSDDVTGMYDLVDGVFYKSMSTTNFSKGDNV